MPTEIFSREQFEAALEHINPNYILQGVISGEYQYLLPIDDEVGITIRSTVLRHGWSADTSKNSIRIWLSERIPDDFAESGYSWSPLSGRHNAVARWITRESGWPTRLTKLVNTLTEWRVQSGNCCNVPKLILQAKTTTNQGRVFAKCRVCGKGFSWLTDKKSS